MNPLPAATQRRLGLLTVLLDDLERQGRARVTSHDLGRWLGTTPATIRKDLSWIGPGSPGAAYEVIPLRQRLIRLLKPEQPRRTALVGLGAGGLDLASEILASSAGLYRLEVGFDARTNRLEQLDVSFPVYPTTEIIPVCLRLQIEAAILSLPAADAQRVAERLVQGGVHYLINYSSAVLRLNRRLVTVQECGLAVSALG